MDEAKKVKELFKDYSAIIDKRLKNFLAEKPAGYALYGHMAYFMGFADEQLIPTDIYGGKRFRSSLCLMLGEWLGVREEVVSAGLSIELFHNFTLIHDDIVDGDTHRRDRKTVWNVWGVPHAINSGDGQLVMSQQVLMKNENLDAEKNIQVQRFLSEQYLKVIEGQYLDFVLTDAKLGEDGVTEAAYFEMIGRKTAELIAAATKVSGVVAGLGEGQIEALYQYGYNLGLAHQVYDDAISIWGKSKQTGKRELGDILERKKTLPIIFAKEGLVEVERERLINYYDNNEEEGVKEVKEIVSLLDSVGAYEKTVDQMKEFADKAKSSLSDLPFNIEQKNTLCTIVNTLLPDIKKT